MHICFGKEKVQIKKNKIKVILKDYRDILGCFLWRCGVAVMTTAQFYSTNPQVLRRFKFCSRRASDS